MKTIYVPTGEWNAAAGNNNQSNHDHTEDQSTTH